MTKQRMINLLQENKEMKSQRTNSTFGFLPTHKANAKKPKELFFANARAENETEKLTLETELKDKI